MYDMKDLNEINFFIEWCDDYCDYVNKQDGFVNICNLDHYVDFSDCVELSNFIHQLLIYKLNLIKERLCEIKDFVLEDNDKFNGE